MVTGEKGPRARKQISKAVAAKKKGKEERYASLWTDMDDPEPGPGSSSADRGRGGSVKIELKIKSKMQSNIEYISE